MKKFLFSIVLLLLFRPIFSQCLQFTPGQWKLMGPSHGRVNTVCYDANSILWVGTNSGGIFITANEGQTWQQESKGLNDFSVVKILKDSYDTLVTATLTQIYVYKSGEWVAVASTNESEPFNTLKLGLNGMWYATTRTKIYFAQIPSQWSAVSGPDATEIFDADAGPDSVQYVCTATATYQNSNGSQAWDSIAGPATRMVVGADNVVILNDYYTSNVYVRKTANTFINTTIKSFLPTLAYQYGKLLVSNFNSVYVSSDTGSTKVEKYLYVTTPVYKSYGWDLRQFIPIDSNTVIIANDNGITKLTKTINGADTLIQFDVIPDYSEIGSFSVGKANNPFIVSSWDHSGLITSDCGVTWNYVNGTSEYAAFIADKQSDLFIARENFIYGPGYNTMRSLYNYDYNNSVWIDQSHQLYGNLPSPTDQDKIAMDYSVYPSRAFLLYQTPNINGVPQPDALLRVDVSHVAMDVNPTTLPLPSDFIVSIAVAPSNGNILYALHITGKLYKSIDGGQTWILISQAFYQCQTMVVHPTDANKIYIAKSSDNTIYLFDGSLSQSLSISSSIAITSNRINSLAFDDKDPSVMYAGTRHGFYVSKNSGQTWEKFNVGLYSFDIRQVVPRGDTVFIGTWGSGIAVIHRDDLLGNSPTIYNNFDKRNLDFQVYPNPNSGTFEMNIAVDGIRDVEIKVYDVLGTLAYSESLKSTAGGIFKIRLQHVATGMYIVEVKTDDRVITKKLMVK